MTDKTTDWIDGWLPDWQFEERHHLHSRATPARLMDAAAAYRPDDDRLIGAALALRESPGRLAGVLGLGSVLASRQRFGKDDFLPLGRLGNQALAYGLVGQFWTPGYGLVRLPDADAFCAYSTPGVAKLMLSFEASQDGKTGTRITTISRLHCPDAATRRRVALYWALIRPVSGLIRGRMLRQIRRVAEAAPA